MSRIRTSERSAEAVAAPDSASAVSAAELARLPRADLLAMIEAGREVQDCYRVLAKTGDNVVAELLHGQGAFYEWNHYPEGDVYDFTSHAQYYYHAHPHDMRPGEHGHFHCFLRPKGMPRGVKPALVAGNAPAGDPDAALCHLVAIAMDDKGRATQLFTTNRWVTAETWYRARDVVGMLDRFAIDLARPSWPVNRWITAMVRLFRPHIEGLLWERDQTVEAWRRTHPKTDVLEDRRLEVASKVDISVEDQLARLQAALRRARR